MAFEKRIQLIQATLSVLERQPLRWTPLLKATIQTCGSPPRLYYTLKYLEKNGFVQHAVIKEKPHWTITEKGKKLLQVLADGKQGF